MLINSPEETKSCLDFLSFSDQYQSKNPFSQKKMQLFLRNIQYIQNPNFPQKSQNQTEQQTHQNYLIYEKSVTQKQNVFCSSSGNKETDKFEIKSKRT